MKKSIYFILISGFLCLIGFAQEQHSRPFQYTGKDKGLSDEHIRCIYKDEQGFIWIGTRSGLNLMNGSSITVYSNRVNGIHSGNKNNITAIAGNGSGKLWIGTLDGLYIFDKTSGAFRSFPLDAAGEQAVMVTAFAAGASDNLFVATQNGLYCIENSGKKVWSLHIPGNGQEKILSNHITHIACGSSGTLWLGTHNGLWNFNEKTKKLKRVIPAQGNADSALLITCFTIDHRGILWAGTWNRGLKEYDPVTQKITTHPLPVPGSIYSLAEIHTTSEGYTIWVNGPGIIYHPDVQQFYLAPHDEIRSYTTPASFLCQLSPSEIWAGTPHGIYFYNPEKDNVTLRHFTTPFTDQAVSVLPHGNHILVSGSGPAFLKEYDSSLNETSAHFYLPRHGHITCLHIEPLGNDSIRCGTTSGIADIDLRTGRAGFISLTGKPGDGSVRNFITSLLKDADGTWWLFPWRNGIWNINAHSHQPEKVFNNFISQYGVPKPLVISSATEDDHHNLLMGDYDEGIIFYNSKTHTFSKPFAKETGQWNTITQVLYYQHHCYSFIENTLLEWATDTPRLQKIKMPAIASQPVTSIAFDSAHHLWIATLNGLFSYDLSSGNFTRFTTSDGLPADELDGILYCRPDGIMIFGSPLSLCSFSPQKMLTSAARHPVLQLAGVKVDDADIVFDTLHPPRFTYTENNFDFRWAVTDYNNPFQNNYYYKLEGVDKDWKYTGKTGRISFINLSPGRYSLLLKGSNANGMETANTIHLSFYISPPFWKTGWFFTLAALAVIGSLYLFYRYRLRQLLKLERLRNKISMNLHDDIGSTLSSISILSDIAMHEDKKTGSVNMLREIKDNSLSLMEKMDDIVWSINPRNDTFENLMLRTRRFASQLFEARDIDYHIEIADNILQLKLPMEERQHLYLIIKEAINNIVKHAGCRFASVTAQKQGAELVITIRDDGNGFDTSAGSNGNGLRSMAQRTAEMNAGFSIRSDTGKGTCITIRLKIK